MLVVTEIYAAGEKPEEGISGARLAEAIRAAGHRRVIFAESVQTAVDFVLKEARSADAVMAIGAGSIGRALDELQLLIGAQVTARNEN